MQIERADNGQVALCQPYLVLISSMRCAYLSIEEWSRVIVTKYLEDTYVRTSSHARLAASDL